MSKIIKKKIGNIWVKIRTICTVVFINEQDETPNRTDQGRSYIDKKEHVRTNQFEPIKKNPMFIIYFVRIFHSTLVNLWSHDIISA